jgi:hypothetical protein
MAVKMADALGINLNDQVEYRMPDLTPAEAKHWREHYADNAKFWENGPSLWRSSRIR